MGQTYSSTQNRIATHSSYTTVCFRGQRHNLIVPANKIQNRMRESQLSIIINKYRGVKYIVERYSFFKMPESKFCRR